MRNTLHSTMLATAAVAALGWASPAWAYSPDLGNHWDPAGSDPSGRCGGPTAVEFDFEGDVTALLPTPVAEDEVINPFYANAITPSQSGATYNPVTVVFDPVANVTRLTESGSPLPLPIPSDFKGPNYFNTFHTGINLGPTVYSLQGLGIVAAVSRRWLWDCGIRATQELPWLAVTSTQQIPKAAGPTKVRYAGVYIETADHQSGKWSLSAYAPPAGSRKPQFTVTNASAMATTVGVMGMVLNLPVSNSPECRKNPGCKDNQILLDQLDDTYYPVPGAPGSPYKPVKVPAKPIPPGGSFRVTAP